MTANPFRAAQRAVKGEMDRLEGLRALFEVLGEGADIQKAINDKRVELDDIANQRANAEKLVAEAYDEAIRARAKAESDAKAAAIAAEATKAEVSGLIDEAREEGRRVIAEAREQAKADQAEANRIMALLRTDIGELKGQKNVAEDELATVRALIDNEQSRLASVKDEIDALKKRFA